MCARSPARRPPRSSAARSGGTVHSWRTVNAPNDNPVAAPLAPLTPAVHPLAAQVASALKGAIFPLTRSLLVEVARENEAPRTFLSLLAALPDRGFRSEDDVAAALDEELPQAS